MTGTVHNPHPPGADFFEQLVLAQAGGEGNGRIAAQMPNGRGGASSPARSGYCRT
jgi:hypothetical protein